MARPIYNYEPIVEKYNDANENPIELAEADAIKEEEFNEPEWFGDPHSDPGISDEETV